MRNMYITSALAAGLTIMAFPAQAGNIGVDTEVSVKTAPSERMSKRIYEVRVDGDSNDSQREVFNEALYKAAKHTLKKEYDWFRIIDKETEKETTETRNSSGFSGQYRTGAGTALRPTDVPHNILNLPPHRCDGQFSRPEENRLHRNSGI